MSADKPTFQEQIDLFKDEERVIHNGQILHEVPGVHTTEAPPSPSPSRAVKPIPAGIHDADPDQLAGLLAHCISAALDETPCPSPMEIVNRLLQLETHRRHKALFTRFDMLQLFAIWSNKLERQGVRRG